MAASRVGRAVDFGSLVCHRPKGLLWSIPLGKTVDWAMPPSDNKSCPKDSCGGVLRSILRRIPNSPLIPIASGFFYAIYF